MRRQNQSGNIFFLSVERGGEAVVKWIWGGAKEWEWKMVKK